MPTLHDLPDSDPSDLVRPASRTVARPAEAQARVRTA
jgi:hypothetical protein